MAKKFRNLENGTDIKKKKILYELYVLKTLFKLGKHCVKISIKKMQRNSELNYD